jgi:LmbE family N-acetylglucosaminyl deacetylase
MTLERTTHMGIAAHADDLEILAIDGILRCLDNENRWFCGVVVGDGVGSPRAGRYAGLSDEDLAWVRRMEQIAAAREGAYGAQVLLDHPSPVIRDETTTVVTDDLAELLQATRPQVLYTHSLADLHDTHVAVVLRVIEAARRLPAELRPGAFYGCEVWRDLDWLGDDDRVDLDVSANEELQAQLLRLFDSQLQGGRRFDLAALGRRRAHAIFHASHGLPDADLLAYAMDLGPLLVDDSLDPADLVVRCVERFADDVARRIRRVGRG